jgi:hypothetical protein
MRSTIAPRRTTVTGSGVLHHLDRRLGPVAEARPPAGGAGDDVCVGQQQAVVTHDDARPGPAAATREQASSAGGVS